MSTSVDGGELSACECPVCFCTLVGDRSPMSLSCGHTLCRLCLSALADKVQRDTKETTFPCPICRKLIQLQSVSCNVTLKNLIEELLKDSDSGRNSTLNIPYAEVKFGRALDRGAFGEVYSGVWRGNDVAIKVFASGQITKASLQSFKREVFVMNCLRHPNVVLMMGACQDPPKLAILMEYVAGGSLYQLVHVNQVVLSLEETCTVAADVCKGLQYLHSINIVHRDLKSKNVLLTAAPPQCQAKLCDFGMARMRLESATMTGNVGTVHWTAPEVMASKRYQFPADVYSLGMVMYEMVTGHIPFHDLLPVAVMMAVAVSKQQPPFPDTAPPALVVLIKQCLLWEAESRPPLADVLTSLLALLQPPTPQPQLSEKKPDFVHSDSLGVVFLSVSDSADLGVEVESLIEGTEGLGVESPVTGAEGWGAKSLVADTNDNISDSHLAQQLQQQMMESQLLRDAQLAEQLQLKENSYRTPSNLVPKTSMVLAKDIMKNSKELKLKTTQYSSVPPPPPPPPLPPPPSHITSYTSKKQQLLKHVKRYAGNIKHKLRPVVPVEKRAFPIGRVVDGYSNDKVNYTFQNLIHSFNKGHLNPVFVTEPKPPFPVGRVLGDKKKYHIQRLASVFQKKPPDTPEPVQSHSLPKPLQSAISSFPKANLQRVNTKISHSLPSQTDIQMEKDESETMLHEETDGFW